VIREEICLRKVDTRRADEFGGDAYMPMLVGPVVAGLLFIGLVHGRAGIP
jgi:hypothetical protein